MTEKRNGVNEIQYIVALRTAKELYPQVNYCTEYEDAYVFSDKNDINIGGKSPVVILKESGEAICMTSFVEDPHGDILDEFDIAE